uniref:Uncharacterized protein n=1 Tax=Anguilla anguilla TaxID=7936 RepID=A0A0E9R296_ANGAN
MALSHLKIIHNIIITALISFLIALPHNSYHWLWAHFIMSAGARPQEAPTIPV